MNQPLDPCHKTTTDVIPSDPPSRAAGQPISSNVIERADKCGIVFFPGAKYELSVERWQVRELISELMPIVATWENPFRAAGQPDAARVGVICRNWANECAKDIVRMSGELDLVGYFHNAVAEATKELRAQLEAKAKINTSFRLFDLVRFMRAELHDASLITDEEYNWLCLSEMATDSRGGSPSPRRLEDYDQLRAQFAAVEAERDALAKKLSDQSMSVIMDCDEFDAIETKAKRCEAAEARCKELERDKEMLDWIGAQFSLVSRPHHPEDGLHWVSAAGHRIGKGKTFREAIADAAASAKREG